MIDITKITKGEWEVDRTNLAIQAVNEKMIQIKHPVCYAKSINRDWKYNAELIAEAGTVANECGMSPREMKNRLDETERLLVESKDLIILLSNQISAYGQTKSIIDHFSGCSISGNHINSK